MPITTTQPVRINSRHLKRATPVLARIGLTPRAAIDVFLAQVALKNDLPFEVNAATSDDGFLPHIPNATTRAAMAESTEGKGYRSAKALMAGLRRGR